MEMDIIDRIKNTVVEYRHDIDEPKAMLLIDALLEIVKLRETVNNLVSQQEYMDYSNGTHDMPDQPTII